MKLPGLAGWLGIPSVCGIATIEVLASRMAPCPRPDPSREKIPGTPRVAQYTPLCLGKVEAVRLRDEHQVNDQIYVRRQLDWEEAGVFITVGRGQKCVVIAEV